MKATSKDPDRRVEHGKMRAVSDGLYRRGKNGNMYVRRRIPTAIRTAYPRHQTHVIRSLGTADYRTAKPLAHAELAKIAAEFELKRQQIDLSRASKAVKRIRKLSDQQLQDFANFWMRQILLTDEQNRQQGLDDDEFEELGERLTAQRAELGRMLAQGKTAGIFPALHGFLYLCGMDFDPEQDQARRASHIFLSTVVKTLDHQLARQRGDLVDTAAVAPESRHPLYAVAPERAPVNPKAPTWDKVFETWRDQVEDRPLSTTIAYRTPWRDLRRFAEAKEISLPGDITPELMTEFVDSMHERGLAVVTTNGRIGKLRDIYKVAAGKHLLASNPAAETLCRKENNAKKRRKRRLPFARTDLDTLFRSEVFTKHTRSKGQSGEASYWIPLLMFYTGARPEEIAGLALSDLRQDETSGYWYLDLIDRQSDEDRDLFDDDVPQSHRRTLKNAPSRRPVPVPQQLIDLGLLRYAEWVRTRGDTVMFPTLRKDTHGKLSGAFSKFFGRYMRAIGITDKRKVLYSLRHNMKDLLEAASVPTKYLKRLLGHSTGDGAVTDGYGSDLPFSLKVEHFARIQFPAIAAAPWQPGNGFVCLKDND